MGFLVFELPIGIRGQVGHRTPVPHGAIGRLGPGPRGFQRINLVQAIANQRRLQKILEWMQAFTFKIVLRACLKIGRSRREEALIKAEIPLNLSLLTSAPTVVRILRQALKNVLGVRKRKQLGFRILCANYVPFGWTPAVSPTASRQSAGSVQRPSGLARLRGFALVGRSLALLIERARTRSGGYI
jgi:hypothetical protein